MTGSSQSCPANAHTPIDLVKSSLKTLEASGQVTHAYLVAAIATDHPSDKVQLTVRRGSSTEHLSVTLGTQPTQAARN